MRIAIFCHSLVSDWNHGNAHFLRGIVSELQARGHDVCVFEPEDAWSRQSLLDDHGQQAIDEFQQAFPKLTSTTYQLHDLRLEEKLDGVDVVIVHEWNHPLLISAVGAYRRSKPDLRLFFHDTHHRALTATDELARFDLANYDGVLAYGASLKELYQRHGWGSQVYVWHEAADIRTFYPRPRKENSGDVVWIGNWGDNERTEELREYFIDPVKTLGLKAEVFGVRYPESALLELNAASIAYRGWLANFKAPETFATFGVTVHVPRRPYTEHLVGIPTIRPFEALACGIPLVSAPWEDTENLFRIGTDFLMVGSGREMRDRLRDVLNDSTLACSLARYGLDTVMRRHTCGHRVDELLTIYNAIGPAPSRSDRIPAAAHS
ncbi:MAG: glycosyltransferase [Acidobacteriota bacterium]|nr:glycosyltransferase [Acidobacteriota bacterium]